MIQRSTGTLTLIAISAILVLFGIFVFELFARELRLEGIARDALALNGEALKLQLDEETGVRGFIATHDRVFLQPYDEARKQLDPTLDRLSAALTTLGVPAGPASVEALRTVHHDWVVGVAQPTIAAHHVVPTRQMRGKMFVDWYRSYSAAIQQAIRGRVMALDAQTNRLFFILSLTALAAMLLIGGAILYYGRRHAMLALQVEREHSIVVTLQRAFSSRFETLPKASLGTAYLSATKEADVGGDLFDARRIDDARGYVLIADVSGKGFDAAVDTALIRYCMRGLCQCMRDPGEMLAALNTVFMSSRTDEDSFVVAFLGVFNSRTLSFKYSSAGHAPAYLRRQGRVEALHVTGPILGLAADETFATKTIRLQDGDTIVLATDGLTEARNEQHKMLTDDGAMRWIAESRGTSPQELIDEIVARLQRYVEGEVKDDLALLALRVEGDAVAEASEVLADFEPVATAEVSAVEGDAGPEGTPRRPPDIQYPPAGYNLLDYA